MTIYEGRTQIENNIKFVGFYPNSDGVRLKVEKCKGFAIACYNSLIGNSFVMGVAFDTIEEALEQAEKTLNIKGVEEIVIYMSISNFHPEWFQAYLITK